MTLSTSLKFGFLAAAVATGFAIAPAIADNHEGGDKMHKGHGKLEKMFKKKDTDGNGMVSKAEFDAYHDAKFAKMDTNNDGSVSMEEAEAYKAMKKEKWKEKKEMMKDKMEEKEGM